VEGLARSQLAGIRLLALAGIWHGSMAIMNGLVFGADNAVRSALGGFTLDVPRLAPLLQQPVVSSIGWAWAALYADLFFHVLRRGSVRTRGHRDPPTLRLLRVPKHIQAALGGERRRFLEPLLLLLQGNHGGLLLLPDLREMVSQTAGAAAVRGGLHGGLRGQHVLHLIEWARRSQGGLPGVWLALHARFFYCFLLALGIFASMLREQRRAGHPRAPRSAARRGVSIFGVWTFFAVINIWNQKGPLTFVSMTQFFFGLIGLH